MLKLKEALLNTIVFHHDDRHIDTISRDRRSPDFAEPGSLVEVAGIERGLESNGARVAATGQGDGLPQDQSADALKNVRRIDVDRDHRSRCALTEPDDPAVALRDEETAALDGVEVAGRCPIPEPRVDDVCWIVTGAECPDGRGVELVKAGSVFWLRWSDGDLGDGHDDASRMIPPALDSAPRLSQPLSVGRRRRRAR